MFFMNPTEVVEWESPDLVRVNLIQVHLNEIKEASVLASLDLQLKHNFKRGCTCMQSQWNVAVRRDFIQVALTPFIYCLVGHWATLAVILTTFNAQFDPVGDDLLQGT